MTSVKQALNDHRAETVRISTTFTIYDDEAPELPVHDASEIWDWPLEAFIGKTLGQIANMVLNTGLEHDPLPPPPEAPPGTPETPVPPDPPPLRERGVLLLEEFTQGGQSLGLPLPYQFGP